MPEQITQFARPALTTGRAAIDALVSSGVLAWAASALWSMAMAPAHVAVMRGGRKVGRRATRRAAAALANLAMGRHVRRSLWTLAKMAALAAVSLAALRVAAGSLPGALSSLGVVA